MPFCQNCGNQIPEGTRYCQFCGAAQTAGSAAPSEPAWQSPAPGPAAARGSSGPEERVFLGVIGMLLGVVVVFLMPIAMEPAGVWVGIQGLCMGLTVFSGYRMLSRRLGVPGTVICAASAAAAVILAEAFVWMLFAETAPVYLPYSGFGLLGTLLREGLAGSFALYLAQAVLFALAGGALLAVPDLRAQRLHPDRMPRLRPGLIFLLMFLLMVACFALFASGENTETPTNSYAYQTVTHFMRGYAASRP